MSTQEPIPARRITRGNTSEQQAQEAVQRIHQEIETTHRETAVLLGSGLATIFERSQSGQADEEVYTLLLRHELKRIQRKLFDLRDMDSNQFDAFIQNVCDIDQTAIHLGVTPEELEEDIDADELQAERWVQLLSHRIEHIKANEIETLQKIEQAKQAFMVDMPDIVKKLGVEVDIEAVKKRIESCKIIVVDPLVAKISDYGGFYDPEERVIGISYVHALNPKELQAVVAHELFHVMSGHTEAVTQRSDADTMVDVVRTDRIGFVFTRNEDVVLPDKTITVRMLDRFRWLNEGITELLTEWYMKQKDFMHRDSGVYRPERKFVARLFKEARISDQAAFAAYFEPGDAEGEDRAKGVRELFTLLRERFGDGVMVQVDDTIRHEGIVDEGVTRNVQIMANLPSAYVDKIDYFSDVHTEIISSATGEGLTSEIAAALMLKHAPDVRFSGFTTSMQLAIQQAESLAEHKSPEFIDHVDDLLESVAKIKPVQKVGKRWEINEMAFEELAGALVPLVALRPYFTPAQRQREAQALQTNGVAKLMREAEKHTDLRDAVAYYIGSESIMLEYAASQLQDDSPLKQMCSQVQRFIAAKIEEDKSI